MIPLSAYVAVSAVLFATGLLGVLIRRNFIIVLMAVEIMLNAGNLALVAFSRLHGLHDGQILAIVVMAIAASEVATSARPRTRRASAAAARRRSLGRASPTPTR